MTRAAFVWHDYRYFPYERQLAKQEVETILGSGVTSESGVISAPLNGCSPEALRRLTYFREVILSDGTVVVPDQARLEASSFPPVAHGIDGARPVPGRQVTRYSAHGLHEYRGKFNPQIVRAIGNLMGLTPGAWVLDPFCGSGTTLLEAAHIGWNAVGIDLNPLAVLISNAKIQAIHAPSSAFQQAVDDLSNRLNRSIEGFDFTDELPDVSLRRLGDSSRLPNLRYLEAWFPRSVLAQLAMILAEIDVDRSRPFRDIFRVVLSDILREVSWQETADLRIRRRKHRARNYPAISLFVKTLRARTDAILGAKRVLPTVEGKQMAFLADAREPLNWIGQEIAGSRRLDAVITSPPYATALPYIDTQRLSLCLLDLTDSRNITPLDRSLVGTREISARYRRELEAMLGAPSDGLPNGAAKLCRTLLAMADRPSNGFRRRNVPALVYKYFSDMSRVFESAGGILRPGGLFAMIIGRNQTRLGGELITIDTPSLLAELACAKGWRQVRFTELDAYQRFEMRRRNSIRSECLVILENQASP